MKNADFIFYTDGSTITNPGVGGWAYVGYSFGDYIPAKDDNSKRLIGSGGVDYATNNQMELRAIIEALESIKERSRICIISDSQYCVNSIMKWIPKWKYNNWLRGGEEITNKEFMIEIDRLMAYHIVSAEWVRSHNGNMFNELADNLARKAAKEFIEEKVTTHNPITAESFAEWLDAREDSGSYYQNMLQEFKYR